jgi:hypothetical protein
MEAIASAAGFEVLPPPPRVEANWIPPSKKIQERRRKGEKREKKK